MKEESVVLEYKKSLLELKESVISLSSMLNKSNQGELYFGIRPDNKVHKFEISKKTLSDVSNEIRTNLKPLPTRLDIDVVKIDDADVIRIFVEGNDTPYSAYGRYYTRVDDGDIPMTSSQLQHFFEQKEDNYLNWEEKPTDYTFDDIDEELLIKIIRLANEKGRLNYIYEDIGKALTKLKLLTSDGKINNAGYYLFGKGKPLLIKEANYPTDTRSEFGQIKQFRGNIFECIEEATSYIQNHITFKSEILGIERIDTPEIPIKAIREIVNNSFAHCKYAVKSDSIQFVIFRSSVKIYNPGSIYKDIDPIKFARGEIGSKIRNILIADILYKCGYIDSFGTGFERTFTLCNKNNVKYYYKNDEFGFTFVFERSSSSNFDKIKPDNDKINDKINSFDSKILSEIIKDKNVTIPELKKILNKSEPTIYRHLKDLMTNGILERNGSRKTGYWSINNKLYQE